MKRKTAKRMVSWILSIIMILSCASACFGVIASAADWVYVQGQSGRVPRTLYIKADQLWNGYSGLIGGSNFIIDENGQSKAVTVGQSGGATKIYTTETGSDTWWAWTQYVLADSEIEHCAVTRTNSGALYNSYSGKYIVNNGTAITSSTGSSTWSFNNNQIYCNSGYMYENSNGIALRSSSSQIYAYTNPTTVYVDVESSGGYYRYAGPESYEISAGYNFTYLDVQNDVAVQYKTSSSASTYQTLGLSENGITLTWDKVLNSNVPDVYTATVKVGETVIDTITVTVKENAPVTPTDPTDPTDPDDPSNPGDDGLPVFPADGSVRIDKWATGDQLKNTGVGEVNLSVTAVPPIYSFGVDVVFVTDVSNSMAWKSGTTRAPENGETSKLQNMQAAVGNFSEILLSRNIPGNIRGNNTVTFTTFGAWDADRSSSSHEYTDPTRTLFVADRDLDDIKSKVNAITFTMPDSNTYYLTFDGRTSTSSSDKNYGGTNYDVGFMEAYDAIGKIKSEYYTQTGEDYDSTSRMIYVIFVTDGAPTLYNGLQYKPVSGSGPVTTISYVNPNTNRSSSYSGYNGSDSVTQAEWYNYIKSTDHAWATKVFNTDHVEHMSTIGIDFPNGGFQASSDYWIFTKQAGYPLEDVLSGLVTGQELDVLLNEDQESLAEDLASVARDVSSFSEGTYTVDLMGTKFNLQMASTVTDANGNVIQLSDYGITPTIKVTRYRTYHKSDVGARVNGVYVTESMIGEIYGTPEVIETVTFSADGTQAFSSKKAGNIMKNGVIDAAFFTYNSTTEDIVTDSGRVVTPESFIWYLGTLSEDEIRLSYNVYLEGSMEGERADDDYATNREAKIFYKDYEGIQREKTYPVPHLSWDEAKLAYELYLVDPDGNPVNLDGERVNFENRETMSELVEVETYLNTSYEIDYDLLNEILPEGYYIYNPNASFDIFMASGDKGEANVNDSTNTTIVYQPEGTTISGDGKVNASQYNDVKVAFAIIKLKINPDVVVLDYGKTILSDPLANDYGSFVINGLSTTGPEAGKNTVDSVKLSNGVATVLEGSVDNNTNVPVGKNVVTPFKLSGTHYAYPQIGKTTTTNDTTIARYEIDANGKVTKYAANSTSGTQIAASLSNREYVVDGDYAITNIDGTAYIVKDYQVKAVEKEKSVDREYYQTGSNSSSTIFVSSSNSGSRTELGELPDGSVISAYYQTQTSGGWWSQTTYYYVYIYDGNTRIASLTTGTSGSFSHTLSNMKDINGNDITITISVSRSSSTNSTNARNITVSAPSVSKKTTTDTITETAYELVTTYKTENEMVSYTPFRYMSSIDRVYYYVSLSSNPARGSDSSTLLYSTITFIPATTVYYEDDFGGSAENGGVYIQYTGDWYTITDDGVKTEGVTANTDTNDRQDRGEVGEGHVPYGYDSSYDESTKFCNGTSAVAEGKTVLVNGKPTSNAVASFTFTGTGFDIISRTDLDCGMITVVINDHETGAFVSSVPVINKGVNNLYQIPVVSYEGLDYGTYDVKITVNAPSKFLGITGSTFYLDAIRIYNPMGLNNGENAEFDEANDAYNADKEANAFTELIRNCLISADDLDVTDSFGAVYVDTLDNDYAEGAGSGLIGNIKSPAFEPEDIRTRMIDFDKTQNMELIGPNEEVYLSRGYGVGFIAESSTIPETVQLEIKIPNPKGNLTLAAQTYGSTDSIKYISLNSATEMYYDITDAVKFTKVGNVYRATVILSNMSSMAKAIDLDGIISITNLKMTYSDDAVINGKDFNTASADTTAVTAAIYANREVYAQAYDTVYVQTVATTPNYDVVNAEGTKEVAVGETATVQFNTANFVEDVSLVDAEGKEIELTNVTCTVDESKLLTDDFQNAKTWTATFKAETEGKIDYTVEATEGEGETPMLTLSVMPAKLVSLRVASAPTQTNYKYGDEINVSGLVLEAKYSDGSTKQIRSGYTLSADRANHLGQKTITVNYDGMSTGFKIKTAFSLSGLFKLIFNR